MLVTLTNPGSAAVYVSTCACSIPALGSVSFNRSAAQLQADRQLMGLVAAGTVTMAVAAESYDTAGVIPQTMEVVAAVANLPAANTVPAGTFMYATAEKQICVSTGSAWLATAALAAP